MRSLSIAFVIIAATSFMIYFSGLWFQYNITNIISSGMIMSLAAIFIFKHIRSKISIDLSKFLLMFSLICWFVAEFLYGYLSGILNTDAYPSVADIFYLTGYFLFVLFLIAINKTYKIELGIILSSLITFSLFVFYVLYVSIFVFDFYSFSGNLIDLILIFVYPIMDLFVVIGSVFYYFRGRSISINKENSYWIFIWLFGVLFFVADLVFSYDDLFKITSHYLLYDLVYNIGYTLLGIAIIIRICYVPQKIQNKYNNP